MDAADAADCHGPLVGATEFSFASAASPQKMCLFPCVPNHTSCSSDANTSLGFIKSEY